MLRFALTLIPPYRRLDPPLLILYQLVMNYLIVEGYQDAAERFLQESGTEPKVDLRTIEDRVAIRKVRQRVFWVRV